MTDTPNPSTPPCYISLPPLLATFPSHQPNPPRPAPPRPVSSLGTPLTWTCPIQSDSLCFALRNFGLCYEMVCSFLYTAPPAYCVTPTCTTPATHTHSVCVITNCSHTHTAPPTHIVLVAEVFTVWNRASLWARAKLCS